MVSLLMHACHRRLAERFAGAGIEDADGEARILLCRLLGLSFTRFFLETDRKLTPTELQAIEAAARRRCNREPLAYILGSKDFFGRDVTVTPAVLIPRPETEILVESALGWLRASAPPGARVLDCGTGSGAIAVTLALELPDVSVYAVDVSAAAVQVAAGNAHQLGGMVRFLRGDLRQLPFRSGAFACIVANLPYIPRDRIGGLQPEVSGYEPHLALDGGPAGTDLFVAIFPGLDAALSPGGAMFFEIGHDQDEFFEEYFRDRSGYGCCRILPDYAGLPRVVRVLKR